MWNKLEELHANRITPNLAYVKPALFAYKMDNSKLVNENLDEFMKMKILRRGTPHAKDDTSAVLILLNALPYNYQVVGNAF